MSTISVVIIAKNEERTIGKVLTAATPLANEMIVVDSGSTDDTVAIAKQCNARVYHQDWLGYPKQKNYALSLATSDWLLSLDADEILTPQLVAEIESLRQQRRLEEYAGYSIPRILHIGELAVRHGGFYPDAQLRLIQRGKGSFNDRLVHEAIKIAEPTRQLKNPMLHMAYKDVAGFTAAMETYAKLSAQEFARRRKTNTDAPNNSSATSNKGSCPQTFLSLVNETIHPWWTFLIVM